jgi:hypothetical protein
MGMFDEAVKGVDGIIHTASVCPFPYYSIPPIPTHHPLLSSP